MRQSEPCTPSMFSRLPCLLSITKELTCNDCLTCRPKVADISSRGSSGAKFDVHAPCLQASQHVGTDDKLLADNIPRGR